MVDERFRNDCELAWYYTQHMLNKLRARNEDEQTTPDEQIATDSARIFFEIIQTIIGRVRTELKQNNQPEAS